MMETINEQYLRSRILLREDNSHKGDYGHLLVVAGCQSMPGAAVLATGAALHSGCGLVTLHSTGRALQAVVNSFPSAMLSEDSGLYIGSIPPSLEKYSAIAVGPGLGQTPETLTALRGLLAAAAQLRKPMVLDADALNMIATHPELWEMVPPRSVLTPHLGELRRLVPRKEDKEMVAEVQSICHRTNCTLVKKGFHTRVFTPDGSCLENTTGNPGMEKGGSGDVLTGLIGGLLARGYSAPVAAAMGVWIHGYSGDCLSTERSAEAYDSRDLIECLWRGFRRICL